MKQPGRLLRLAGTLLLTTLLALPLGAVARQNDAEDDSANNPATDPAPSFWRVEGENNTVWLFGSIHVLTEEHYPLADPVESAFDASNYLVVETDTVNLDPQVQQQLMLNTGMLRDGKTLESVLGDQFERAAALASENGYSLQQMQALKPWLAALVIQVNEFQKLGYTAEHGVDTYFLEKATEGPQSIVELESFRYQLSLFEDLAPDTQNAFLMQTLEEIDDAEQQIDDLMSAWESGELDSLEETLMADFDDYPELHDRIITDRNRDWVEKITDYLENGEQDYFVVVGALHMVGEEGVVELLRDAGHTVERQ